MSTVNTMADIQTGREVVLPARGPFELTGPRFTAAQIEQDCPAQLHDLAKKLTEGLEKLCEQETLVGDQKITVKKLIAEAKALCDVEGFAAFREKFFPNLRKSRAYELLAIGTNKKSVQDIKAGTRGRVAKHRAKKAEASLNSVTVTEKSKPESCTRGAPNENGEIEAPGIASEQTPEPSKPWTARASVEGMRVFTVHTKGLYTATDKRPPEHFSETAVSVEILEQLANFYTRLADLKKSEVVNPGPTEVRPDDGNDPDVRPAVIREQAAPESNTGEVASHEHV